VSDQEIIEQLADEVHAIWAHWMKYLFSICAQQPDGSVIIPPDKVERWQRQLATPYQALSEREKQSDRNQAVKLLRIIQTTESR
jgi:Cft2 family RNA processing exonuclease